MKERLKTTSARGLTEREESPSTATASMGPSGETVRPRELTLTPGKSARNLKGQLAMAKEGRSAGLWGAAAATVVEKVKVHELATPTGMASALKESLDRAQSARELRVSEPTSPATGGGKGGAAPSALEPAYAPGGSRLWAKQKAISLTGTRMLRQFSARTRTILGGIEANLSAWESGERSSDRSHRVITTHEDDAIVDADGGQVGATRSVVSARGGGRPAHAAGPGPSSQRNRELSAAGSPVRQTPFELRRSTPASLQTRSLRTIREPPPGSGRGDLSRQTPFTLRRTSSAALSRIEALSPKKSPATSTSARRLQLLA